MTLRPAFIVSAAAALLLTGGLASAVANAALPIAVEGEPLPSLAPMVKRVSPAVVNIATEGTVETEGGAPFNDPFLRRFFGVPEDQPQQPRERRTNSLGSGVVVDADQGIVITNHHVVATADEITVTLSDGREIAATLLGSDEASDVAVLKIPTDGVELTEVAFGDSDALQVGDFAVAIGNPFGFTNTVTSGIVSALGRSPGMSLDSYEDFIQTDASINPGNSGGALLNLRGELIGINTAIISRSGGNIGIGFAIPVNMARVIMDQIIEYGEVRRGLLGVNIYTVDSSVSAQMGLDVDSGAFVSEVVPGSAADRGGIKAGDVITAVNGKKVESAQELRNVIGLMQVDDEVKVQLSRKGRETTISTRLGSRTIEEEPLQAASLHEGLDGAEFSNIDEEMTDFSEMEGVVVTSVVRNSPAARRGLRPGDLITGVNNQAVTNLQEFSDVASGVDVLFLEVVRGERTFWLRVG
jgi:serine protease Do/serine protease DegQ